MPEKLFLTLACVLFAVAAHADITSRPWGTVEEHKVDLYTLDNGLGLKAEISNYGATIVSLHTKDAARNMGDVVLGFKTLEEYRQKSPYFGCVVGRYGNRIAYGSFVMNGLTYKLPINNEPADIPCSLHGGTTGFDRKVWTATPKETSEGPALELVLYSGDGDMGYPGNLRVKVIYTLAHDALRIEYSAICDQDTPINLTQHSYFNLKGEGNGDILSHDIRLFASKYTPVNAGLIPTGKIDSVVGTPFDFLAVNKIGARIESTHRQMQFGAGYDHNYVLDKKYGEFGRVATVSESTTGRSMDVYSTEPGVQFYSGNFLDGKFVGKSGKPYVRRGGFCLETQHYPDSPNQPEFPSTILPKGKVYRSKTEYRFSTFS